MRLDKKIFIFPLILGFLTGCSGVKQFTGQSVIPQAIHGTSNVAACSTPNEGSNINKTPDVFYTVDYRKRTEEICDEQGRVLGVVSADVIEVLPVDQRLLYMGDDTNYLWETHSDELTSLDKVNDYINSECDAFFDGNPLSSHFQEGFREKVNFDVFERNAGRDSELRESPIGSYLSVNVSYMNGEILSLYEEVVRGTGLSLMWESHGLTFDLKTGSQLTPTSFLSCDINQFNEIVESMILDYFYCHFDTGHQETPPTVEELMAELESYTFEDYDFFYTGDKLWIVFQCNMSGAFWRDSLLLSYDGQYLLNL